MRNIFRNDRGVAQFFKSATTSSIALALSVAVGFYLKDNRLTLGASESISSALLFVAALDIGVAVLLEPYCRRLSALTIPAMISVTGLVLLFAVADALNRFSENSVGHVSYNWLTPFVITSLALIYGAMFKERSLLLKGYFSLNSMAVMFLWALGSIDKVMMPF
jgi:hypothetical protein